MVRERTVKDQDGTEWTCVQAYAGLQEAPGSITAKLSGCDRYLRFRLRLIASVLLQGSHIFPVAIECGLI